MAMVTSRDAVLRVATGSRKTMAQFDPLLIKASAILFEECGVCNVTAVQELSLSLTDLSDGLTTPHCPHAVERHAAGGPVRGDLRRRRRVDIEGGGVLLRCAVVCPLIPLVALGCVTPHLRHIAVGQVAPAIQTS
jgi:hypothetical protein